MGSLQVLDCTLRDGGYCNQWKFGKENIGKIIGGLIEAGIDIIECGFLTSRLSYDENATRYRTVNQVNALLPKDIKGMQFVCMINYGEFKLEDLPEYDGGAMSGLRVAFHKKDALQALDFCKGIKEKGYKVFIQAMAAQSYSDKEYLDLIQIVNDLEPNAFYIVDSFGVMKRKDIMRLFYMVEHNLKDTIAIGFHAHNNLQLAYSNAQFLVDTMTSRNLIIDSSIYGMGRGAGNLNTELFVEYLNDQTNSQYQIKPLLTVIDEILNAFFQKNSWGYSLPYYLSAKNNAHPNYASYLDAKKTLTIEAMDEIFSMMEESKKINYDPKYAEELYSNHLETGHVQEKHLSDLRQKIYGKDILLIAPGPSSAAEREKVVACADQKDIVSFCVNFEYPECKTDFIFLSNLRRFRELDIEKRKKCIVTSNIPASDVYLQTSYGALRNHWEYAQDNAGMMLIKYLIQLGAKRVLLAGVDGYSPDSEQNYADERMNFYARRDATQKMNIGIINALREFREQIQIDFVTTPRFIKL